MRYLALAIAGGGLAICNNAVAAPGAYAIAGIAVGGAPEIEGGATLDGGVHVSGPLWAHGFAEAGAITTGPKLFPDDTVTSGRIYSLRGGIELRTCTRAGGICGVAGQDIGGWLVTELDPGSPIRGGLDAVGATHAALELGDPQPRGVRMRVGLEFIEDLGSPSLHGADLTMGVGYQW